MNNQITNEIVKLENRYWQAMADKNIDEAVQLTRFPCTVSGPEGFRQINESDYRNLMASMDSSSYQGVNLEDPVVEVLSDDMAMIHYKTNINGMEMLDSSLWTRQDHAWACKFHSEFPKS